MERVHLLAKLLQQCNEVFSVVLVGVLPVNVNAIEQVRRFDAGSDVALQKHGDAGLHKGDAVLRFRSILKQRALAHDADEHAQARIARAEQLELVKVAAQGCGGLIGRPVDAVGCLEDEVRIRLRVGDHAAVVADVSLCVVDLGERLQRATRDQVFGQVASVVHAPLREVTDDLVCGLV